MTSLTEQPPMSRTSALLIGSGLVYLAVPNLLFLLGWFTPPVAVAAGTILALYVGRQCALLLRGASPETPAAGGWWKKSALLAGLALLLVANFLTSGIVGVFKPHPDYFMFRQALFCNVRDAAWPLVLPRGGEMSYYLANVLPPALLARVLPVSWGQWCLVFWGVLPVFLSLLVLAAGIATPSHGKWRSLFWVAFLFFIVQDPLYFVFHSVIGKSMHDALLGAIGWDCSVLLCPNSRIPAPLGHCIGAYNSVPPALLAAAILFCGGRENRRLVPLVYALLVAISPLACIGLLPLAVWQYCRAWRGERVSIAKVAVESPFPLTMAFLCAIYFERAESGTFMAPCYAAWGWEDSLCGVVRVGLAWALLALPLVKVERGNGLFWVASVFLLGAHLLFLGSPETMNNELWLKSAPAYVLVLAAFWAKDWHLLPKVKYAVVAMCLIGFLHSTYKSSLGADISQYGVVCDVWNGHLNHTHPFLRQSVPPTHAPIVPGILLRSAGESETHFPGSLLPHAPGCDYSRPAEEKIYR